MTVAVGRWPLSVDLVEPVQERAVEGEAAHFESSLEQVYRRERSYDAAEADRAHWAALHALSTPLRG